MTSPDRLSTMPASRYSPFQWLRSLYAWVLGWGERKHGKTALF
jgi:hypothetical protein